MKLEFAPKESAWLHRTVNHAVTVANRNKDMALLAAMGRLRYKFGPSKVTTVSLKRRERDLLGYLVSQILLRALEEDRIASQVELLQSISDKLQGAKSGGDE